ncbi:zinc finger CCCH domain-containing protein 5 [Rhododendron vialii]|uniref:zinc finger CCCH domain-containing protein 5 n=1 Tax=Rhododendron vialii TaxID=182163 RepID=UPI00265F66F2|nr:zinc finger CCCH domain-containing protein 5 [Rhododendron vialii]XP_058214988.1 zinc finger CCCH domain-containing protein 5 [Rhododendron vialii]
MAEKIAGVEQQSAAGNVAGSRIERRKAAKKEKRRQKRKELAVKELEEEEARLNDPEEQRMIQLEEEREKERVERERREFEEHERVFLEALAAKRKADDEEEEEERRKALEDESKQKQVGHKDEKSDDDWEYIEEGPPEIIWQGNEIIVKKKKVRVKRKDTAHQIKKEDPNRPTSNPLPPQSEAFADYRNGFVASAQQLLDNVAQQTPNFGTEQDKDHCPFHLKTGACRFGSRCNRVHFYPDKSCTLLIKNMYSGPGLAWEQDEGLEVCNEVIA